MGGTRGQPLFDLGEYSQRMAAEDAAVANALRMVEVRSSSGSMGSNLSDASAVTRFNGGGGGGMGVAAAAAAAEKDASVGRHAGGAGAGGATLITAMAAGTTTT